MVFYFLLDAMVYNYTPFASFFLLTNIKESSPLELFLTSLFLWFLSKNLLLVFLILFLYIVNRYISINTTFFKYNLLINFLNYIVFLFFLCFLYKKSITTIFIESILVNFVFWILSYIFSYKSIYTIR